MHMKLDSRSCRRQAALLGLALTFLCAALAASAADWPQWCGTAGKNMVSTETGIPDTFYPGDKNPGGVGFNLATAKNVQWIKPMGAYTVSSPTVVGDRVFIGGVVNRKGIFRCFDAKTGQMIWQWLGPIRDVPKKHGDRQFAFSVWQGTLGVASTAAVENGRVYFVTNRCEVICLAAAGDPAKIAAQATQVAAATPDKPFEGDTSKVLWTFDMYGTLGSRPANVSNGSVVIDGDILYVCTANGVDRQPGVAQHDEFRPVPGPDCPSLIALDKNTGRLLASDDVMIAAGPRMLHGQYSSPTLGRVGGKTLVFYAGGDGILYAFEALEKAPEKPVKLKLAWSCDCVPREYQEAHKAVGKDMLLHYCQGDKRRADSSNKKNDGTWVGMLEFISTPVFFNGRVYIAVGRDPDHGRGRGALWCIDPTKTGDITESGKIWCYQGLDRTLSTVSIADGILYISDMAGRVHCMDPETGKVNWVHETKAEVWGSTLVVDGKVLLPTHKGLFTFAHSKEKKLLGQVNLGSQMYCSPVVANGTLYVASRNYLWAVKK